MKKIIMAETVLRDVGQSHTLFGRGGITMIPARSSEEILDLHRSEKADLIVTDVDLPVMGGARLCAFIRSDAALKDVSLVMVCDGTDQSRLRCQQAGANTILTKPVDPFELFSRISELLIIPQRQSMRAVLQVSVSGKETGAPFVGVSHNISISGMLIEAKQELSTGDRLACTMTIAGREIVVECEIVRAEGTPKGRFRYGVKFINPDMKSLIIIEQVVKGNIKH